MRSTKEICDLLNNKEYDVAEKELLKIIKQDDRSTREYSNANYLLGCLYNIDPNRGQYNAKSYLRVCINGNFPIARAYAIYSDLESDNNVALSYIMTGLSKFPEDLDLLEALFRRSTDKSDAIRMIRSRDVWSATLLTQIIEYFYTRNDWSELEFYLLTLERFAKEYECDLYLQKFLLSLTCIFTSPDAIAKAIDILNELIVDDIDNSLCYAHYIALAYAYVLSKMITEAEKIIQKVPLNNRIYDLDDGPRFINLNFSYIYKKMFGEIEKGFQGCPQTRLRAQAIYVLYLYFPYISSDYCRFGKKELKILERSLSIEYIFEVACALYNMYCYFDMLKEANAMFLNILKHGNEPEDGFIYYSTLLDKVDDVLLKEIVSSVKAFLQEVYVKVETLLSELFDPLVEELHSRRKYDYVNQIVEEISLSSILKSNSLFECAYCCAEKIRIKQSLFMRRY